MIIIIIKQCILKYYEVYKIKYMRKVNEERGMIFGIEYMNVWSISMM